MKRQQKKMLNRTNQRQQATVNLNPADLPDVACQNVIDLVSGAMCGNKTFIPGLTMKKVSAIISPKGIEGYANFSVSICIKCFTPLPLKP